MRDRYAETPNFLDKKDCRFSVLYKSFEHPIQRSAHAKHWYGGFHQGGGGCPVVFRCSGHGHIKICSECHFLLEWEELLPLWWQGAQTPHHIVREYSPDHNKKGTFTESHISNKIVHIYPLAKPGERCHVCILDRYLSKLPKEAFGRDNFYLRPLTALPANPVVPGSALSQLAEMSWHKWFHKCVRMQA